MTDLQPSIKRVCVVTDENNIIKKYSRCLSEQHVPYENGLIIETNLDLDIIDLVDNYRVVDWKLIELTEEEKPEPQHQPSEIQILQVKMAEQEEQIMLQEETTLDIDYRVTCIELGI